MTPRGTTRLRRPDRRRRMACAARCGCGRSPPTRWRSADTARCETEDGARAVRDRDGCAPRRTSGRALRRASTTATRPRRSRNIDLYVPRESCLPPDAEDEFYHADLIGLAVVDARRPERSAPSRRAQFRRRRPLEIRPTRGGATVLMPFTEAAVPEVDHRRPADRGRCRRLDCCSRFGTDAGRG